MLMSSVIYCIRLTASFEVLPSFYKLLPRLCLPFPEHTAFRNSCSAAFQRFALPTPVWAGQEATRSLGKEATSIVTAYLSMTSLISCPSVTSQNKAQSAAAAVVWAPLQAWGRWALPLSEARWSWEQDPFWASSQSRLLGLHPRGLLDSA